MDKIYSTLPITVSTTVEPVDPKEKNLMDLVAGKTPVTEYEKELAKEIRELIARGIEVYIPSSL